MTLVRPGPLSLPFFWDEADVYVPGARWLAEHGLDFRPGVFPDDWSRGHPPLLYFVSGAAFALFGATPVVGHLVVLPFAVLALVCTWLLGDTLFGRPAGAAAALLLGATPLFMSMANMLLPEMPLTGLTALALLLFARGRIGLAALTGAALVLIKETGVFVPAALAGAVLWRGWMRGELRRRETWLRFGISCAPILVLCAFFAWQKALAGYFIFPHHQGLLWDRPLGWMDLGTVFPSLLAWHGRWIAVLAAVPVGVVALTRPDARRAVSPTVVAIALLVLGNALFFTKMFWLERYALPAHPGVLVLVAGALVGRGRRLAPGLARSLALALPFAVAFGALGLWSTPAPDEAELTFAYADVIETHRRAFDALPPDAVVLTTWPLTEELRQPDLGFVDQAFSVVHARHLDGDVPVLFDHVLVAPGSSRAQALVTAAGSRGLSHRGSFRVGAAPQPLHLYGP